jgi:hypothetical protein
MSVEVLGIILRRRSFLLSFVTEWMSGSRTKKILFNIAEDGVGLEDPMIYYNLTLQAPAPYTEILDQPEWGTLYFATPSVSSMAICLLFSSHSL